MRGLAKKNKEEADLAYFCLETVRRVGGVLEHPFPSLFFREAGLMSQAVVIDQSWFGFPSRKRTLLYVNGLSPRLFPPYPFHLGERFHNLDMLGKAHRARTYPALCDWLVTIAATCRIDQSTTRCNWSR